MKPATMAKIPGVPHVKKPMAAPAAAYVPQMRLASVWISRKKRQKKRGMNFPKATRPPGTLQVNARRPNTVAAMTFHIQRATQETARGMMWKIICEGYSARAEERMEMISFRLLRLLTCDGPG